MIKEKPVLCRHEKIPKLLFSVFFCRFYSEMLQVFAVLIVLTNFCEDCQALRVKRDQNLECGVPHQGLGLVVGGEISRKGDFPW